MSAAGSAVLDASAVLAVLHNEPGCEMVEAFMRRAVVSTVNLAEVGAVLSDRGMPTQHVQSVLSTLEFEVAPFDESAAMAAIALRPSTRALGLSLGDRACLALGQARRLPVLTADRNWAGIGLELDVRLIRD
jgi:PIN domain nuclease of toxin-antitoxin system